MVIGGGPAGISGSEYRGDFWQACRAGRKTPRCRWRWDQAGQIPSKTLRETALALQECVRANSLASIFAPREATVGDFMRHKDNVAAHERRRREEQMRTFNVETFHGAATFVDPHTVRVAPDTLLRARKF